MGNRRDFIKKLGALVPISIVLKVEDEDEDDFESTQSSSSSESSSVLLDLGWYSNDAFKRIDALPRGKVDSK